MNERNSVFVKIRAYRLGNKIAVSMTMILVVILSIVVYVQPWMKQYEVTRELLMAVFTSLLVSALVLLSEVYVTYKDNERDQFLEDIHTFGIANLNQNKEEVLKHLLQDCDNTIWISGYRLIMTNNLKMDFAEAINRGAKGVAILCAPWTDAFKLVYGEKEKVMNNYFEVFHAISSAIGEEHSRFSVYITEKPIFSDTYRIDQNLISGPYMHNTDKQYNRIMAKDFFSYNLAKQSRLYNLIYNEFETLENESKLVLNWERFNAAYEERINGDFTEREQCEMFRNACDAKGSQA